MSSGGALEKEKAPPEGIDRVHSPDPDQDQIAHIKSMDRVIHDAKAATEKEQKMSLMEGIKLYPKAIAWSVLISTCIVMVS